MEAIIPWLPIRVQAIVHSIVLALCAEFIFFVGLVTDQPKYCIFALIFLALWIIVGFILRGEDREIARKQSEQA